MPIMIKSNNKWVKDNGDNICSHIIISFIVFNLLMDYIIIVYISGKKIRNNDSNVKNVNPKQVFMVSNNNISEFMDNVKPHIQQLINDINAVSIIF